MALELDYDKSLYGIEHQAGPFEVTADQVRAFSRGIGETNPIHIDCFTATAIAQAKATAPTILSQRCGVRYIGSSFSIGASKPQEVISRILRSNLFGLPHRRHPRHNKFAVLVANLDIDPSRPVTHYPHG